MTKPWCTDSQIVAVLREYDADRPIADLARRHGIHADVAPGRTSLIIRDMGAIGAVR